MPFPKVSPEEKERRKQEAANLKRHRDWEMNQELIYQKYIELALAKKSAPKIVDVARACNLSERTVHRHLDQLDFDAMKQKFRVFTEACMFSIAKNAMTGKSVEWSKLYFDVVHGINNKKQIDITTNGKEITPDAPSVDVSKLSTQTLMELINATNTNKTEG